MKRHLVTKEPPSVAERPGRLIGLWQPDSLSSSQPAVQTQWPLVKESVDGSGIATQTHGKDLPIVKAGGSQQSFELCQA